MDSLIYKFAALGPLDDGEDEGDKSENKPNLNVSELATIVEDLSLSDSENKLKIDGIDLERGGCADKIAHLYCNLPTDFNWDEASRKGAPEIPDYEIDFEKAFANLSKLGEVEKHLELLYKPFTCMMDVSCRFNMYELCILLPDARYDPGIHPSVAIKVRNPSANVKIFSGGKMVSTALTAASARNALFKVVRVVQELDYKADIKNFSKNIVNATFMMPFKIDLQRLNQLYSDKVTHNNAKRPFITYTLDEDGVRFAVFPTGYVLALHSSCRSETSAAIATFLPILAKFKNGYATSAERQGRMVGDISYKLLWERRLEEDKEELGF
ncbi:uncharacterized protein Dana_GF13882, isoform B [Drosophila ananassae]|uniref:Uncharacterized protein, isoform B n=1 Tax=Drosophila ananassae TaxID=7217 RepID=A0A0P9A8G5_DROAN|nr:TATA-box-binding protein 2 isoform X2 [Drosophila ananassae]KPU74617.1 uncharacterized protein Dana_GF13882, isoform B [Drosophila ananassae]